MNPLKHTEQLNCVDRGVTEDIYQRKTTRKRKYNTDNFTNFEEIDKLFRDRKLMKTRRTMPNVEQNESEENSDSVYSMINAVDKSPNEMRGQGRSVIDKIDDFKNISQLNNWAINDDLMRDDLVNLRRIELMCDEITERGFNEGLDFTHSSDDSAHAEDLNSNKTNYFKSRKSGDEDGVKVQTNKTGDCKSQIVLHENGCRIIAIIDAFTKTEELNKWAFDQGLMNEDIVNLKRIQLMCDEINESEDKEKHRDNRSGNTSTSQLSTQLLFESASRDLKFLSLNVCGLKRKLKAPDFMAMISQYDIIALQETFLDDDDYVIVPGYVVIHQNRRKLTKRRSGGIAFLFKVALSSHIVPINNESLLIQWIRISKCVMKTDYDITCGNAYIPPYNTKYASKDPYLDIQAELDGLCRDIKFIVLLGDFNSRTGSLPDYKSIDDDSLSAVQRDSPTENMLLKLGKLDLPLKRRNVDCETNKYGRQLIKFCLRNELLILNGRFGKDVASPEPMNRRSTVDYCISSVAILNHIRDCSVNDFSRSFSDWHNGIALTMTPFTEK